MLILSPPTIGEPHWEQVQPGDISNWLVQYYDISKSPRTWKPVPWGSEATVCRAESNWRRPVSFRAKAAAVRAALPLNICLLVKELWRELT